MTERLDTQLEALTPENLLVIMMADSAAYTSACAACHQFGWDLEYGTSTNNARLIEAKKRLDQSTRIYFHKTRGGI